MSDGNDAAIQQAVESGKGGFVAGPSELDHALESADVVCDAIRSFPMTLLELGGDKAESFNTCQSFLQAWTMEKNKEHRPAFLGAVANPDTLELLLSYVRPESPGVARPRFLLTNALGVLNRLVHEPSVARLVARQRLRDLLDAFAATTKLLADDINTQLMFLEIIAAVLPCAEAANAESAMTESGWLAIAMEALRRPAVIPDDAESAAYRSIAAMLACRCLTGMVCARDASTQVRTMSARAREDVYVTDCCCVPVCHSPRVGSV